MRNSYIHTIQPGDYFGLLAEKYNLEVEEIYRANPMVNPYYLYIGQPITIPANRRARQQNQTPHCISQAEVDYRNDMRSLWEEHVAWTRMAIISLTFNLPDINFVLTRLLKNATDMGNMIRRLYGDIAAKTYGELIKEHLLLAADLVKAVLAGDMQKAAETEKMWYANADQIAKFLSSENPFLPEEVVRDMFYHHLDLTKQEAISMINKDYQKDIEIYDQIEKQAREMADTISDAMVKFYPQMF